MAWAVHRSRRYGASISHTTPHINPQLPPTPPVDPDNVEFVVFVRSKKVNTASLAFVVALHMGACLHTYLHACVVPPCLSSTINDLNHPLHIAQLPKWVPLSIIKGGTSANMLVKSLESDWGNRMFKGQLVNNMAPRSTRWVPCMTCLQPPYGMRAFAVLLTTHAKVNACVLFAVNQLWHRSAGQGSGGA